MWKVQYLRVKIVCHPPKWGILTGEGSVFYAQAVCLPVLRALRIHHCIQSVLDGAAKAAAVPKPAGSETDPASPLSLAAQAVPQTDTARYCLQDSGGRVAVYTCRADGTPGTLIRVTGIYTNLLPENDALRIKRGLVVNSPRELDLLLEDLGE